MSQRLPLQLVPDLSGMPPSRGVVLFWNYFMTE